MKISTKGRYALRMMLDLAQNQGEGYVSLKDISTRQGISKKYLEQIVPAMSKAGLLLASRGFQGGYRLCKPAQSCTVGEILRAAEGDVAPVACLCVDAVPCDRQDRCLTLPVWSGLDRVIREYLDSVTLERILQQEL